MPWHDTALVPHNRDEFRYPSDLTDQDWALVAADQQWPAGPTGHAIAPRCVDQPGLAALETGRRDKLGDAATHTEHLIPLIAIRAIAPGEKRVVHIERQICDDLTP